MTALLIALVLLAANAFFVAAEFALVAARRTLLEQQADEGDRRAAVAVDSIKRLSLMLAGAQLGITMASLALGFVAEPAVGHLVAPWIERIGWSDGITHAVELAIALSIVVFFHMVLGEMAPKSVALADPEQTARRLAPSMRRFVLVLSPAITALNAAANGVVRLLGVDPADTVDATHTVDDLATMLAASAADGMVDETAARLLADAMGFRRREVGEVMVPRSNVTALPVDCTPEDLRDVVDQTGHSRVLVYGRDLDDVVGFVHAKALLDIPALAWRLPLPARHVTPMLVVTATRRLPDVLFEMQRTNIHLALVVDTDGVTQGLVTMEDLLESIVGDITDEFDRVPRRR